MVTIRWLREQIRQGKTIYDLPLRVTFYARVSTEKVEQQGSLENQIQYYTEFIQKNPNWTYVPGYIDATDIIGLKQNPTNGRRFSPIFLCIGHFSE